MLFRFVEELDTNGCAADVQPIIPLATIFRKDWRANRSTFLPGIMFPISLLTWQSIAFSLTPVSKEALFRVFLPRAHIRRFVAMLPLPCLSLLNTLTLMI